MFRWTIIVFLFLGFVSAAQSHGSTPDVVDVIHYRFEIELSDQSDAITGKATITVKFLAPASEIKFDLASLHEEKGMIAFQVTEAGKELKTNQADDVLSIQLLQSARTGEERSFVVNYMGTPKDGLIISKNKYGDRTFFADNWPNRAHNWIPCIDRPDDKASFEFIVTAPSQYRVVSNGTLIEEKILDAQRKRTSWKEATALSTKVMVIGAARFAVKNYSDSPPAVPVSAWVYAQDSVRGFFDYAVAPAIVKFFSGYIAPFPYEKLANVQSKTIFGGMENASAIFYAEESVTGDRKWEDVLAHEIAHQWFGDMASEKSFAHLWLSEGFATYLTDIYLQNKYGKDTAVKRLQKEREDIVLFAQTNNHPVVDSTPDLMSLLNANSYQKGSWILHMLQWKVGDSLFQKIIQGYYQQYKGSNADTRDFEAVAERVSGRDLHDFFNFWLYQPQIPQIKLSYSNKGDHPVIMVEQTGKSVLDFWLPLGYKTAQGNIQEFALHINQRSMSFNNEKGKGLELLLDPLTQLLFSGAISKIK
ncbi:MAG: M1 family metallopeptidase [Flavisolibacter sp.]